MSSLPPPPLPQSRTTHPKAIASMVCGIVGLLFFGVVLGVVAIVLGVQSRAVIRQQPLTFKGDGVAIAGIVLGIFDVVAFVVIMVGGA